MRGRSVLGIWPNCSIRLLRLDNMYNPPGTPMITVADVVADPSLNLTILAGRRGAIAR